jgi:hypothetical protein
MVVLLRGIARVVIAETEHLFLKRASVPEAAKLGSRKRLASDPCLCQTEKKNRKIEQRLGGGRSRNFGALRN